MSLGKKYSIFKKAKEDYTRTISRDYVCFTSDNIQMGSG